MLARAAEAVEAVAELHPAQPRHQSPEGHRRSGRQEHRPTLVDLQCGGEQPAGAEEGHRDAGHHHGEAHHGQHDRNRRLAGGIPEVDGRELGLELGKGREVVDELGDTSNSAELEPGTRAVPRPFTDA